MHLRTLTVLTAVLIVGLAACSTSDDTAESKDGTEASVPSSEGPTVDETTPELTVEDAVVQDDAVFDPSVVHTIAVQFADDDYDAMIATYEETGDKGWIEATVTIDGTTFERVGLRLKGNSSLAGLGGAGGIGGFPGRTPTETGGSTPANTGEFDTGPTGGMAEFGGASADEPENLPWLIRLDEFVDDQTYQGYEDFVVRSNNTETSMNEAVTLALLSDAGLASQDAIATRFSMNDSDEVLRLVVEHPDDDAWYEASFDGDGALYKAESTGDWTYRGDDPASYDEVFDQEGGSDVADLTPLIEFLNFINNSDEATFAAELADRIDVDAFATYLAMMELVGNTDDIDGPGNNAYLWWDAETGQFTVVPWDMNLALGSGMGFPGGPGEFPGGTLPDGAEFPADFGGLPGGSLPEGATPPGAGGFGGRSNPLVERFLANEEFNALYETRLAELTEELMVSGDAEGILADWIDLLETQAGDLVSTETVESEAASIRDFLSNATDD
jgi:spore coat protein CotH